MRILTTAFLFCALALCAAAQTVVAPAYSSTRLDKLVAAISRAEGFGIRGTLATRYHNPGNFRAVTGVRFPGQVRIGKHQYIVFKSDAAGKAVLRAQLVAILDGRSRLYRMDMTITQLARTYATSWRTWSRYVSHELHVLPTTTLRQYLCGGELDVPPTVYWPTEFPAGVLEKGENTNARTLAAVIKQ